MSKITLKQVKERCAEGRFFSYVGFHDKLFSPAAIVFVWLFVRLGWSGNAVSILSGVAAMVGGMLLASEDPLLIVVGSFGYMIFFFLDYVDGGVARIRGQSGIGGQYVDWTMHVVSAVGVSTGLALGALGGAGAWIVPFAVLFVVASALALDRYSLAWFAICMHYQQQRVKGDVVEPNGTVYTGNIYGSVYLFFRRISTLIFHENYAIFLLPILAVIQYFWPVISFDFRVVIVVLGGVVYFPVVLYDIWLLATKGRVDNSYKKLFFGNERPELPGDHFLK